MRELTANEVERVVGGANFEHRAFRGHIEKDMAGGSGRGAEKSANRAWPSAAAIAAIAGVSAIGSSPVAIFGGLVAGALAGTRLYAEIFPAEPREERREP